MVPPFEVLRFTYYASMSHIFPSILILYRHTISALQKLTLFS